MFSRGSVPESTESSKSPDFWDPAGARPVSCARRSSPLARAVPASPAGAAPPPPCGCSGRGECERHRGSPSFCRAGTGDWGQGTGDREQGTGDRTRAPRERSSPFPAVHRSSSLLSLVPALGPPGQRRALSPPWAGELPGTGEERGSRAGIASG